MNKGYCGKILRVDLTQKKVWNESLPDEEVLKKYIGCYPLGLWYLDRMVKPGTHPLDPENPMIFLTGPLTGTSVPSATNTTLVTLNASTKRTVGRSHTHGFFGVYLKFSGYDGIIVEGASEDKVYLYIDENGGELRDASKFWSLDTHETETAIKEEIGEKKMSVAAIGPAGENLCFGALIENDLHASFAHSGVGTIMGSKKLKAIAIKGKEDGNVDVADSAKMKETAKAWREALQTSEVATFLGKAGIPRDEYVGVKEALEVLTAKNMTTTILPEYGRGMASHKITPWCCWRCPTCCKYDVEMTSGPHKGFTASLAGGGEDTEGAASIVGVTDSGTIFYLTDLNDRLGFDTAASGTSMGVAFEAFEKGLISTKDTDGLELTWGHAEAVEALLRKMAKREGFGNVVADGPLRTAMRMGIPDAAIHIKGAAMNLHDWRTHWGVLLAQIVGGGAGWGGPGEDCWATEADIGYPEFTDPLTPKGKPKEVYDSSVLKFGYGDALGCCWFAVWGVTGVTKFGADALSAATGWNITKDDLLLGGERIINLERIFNLRMGITAEDDIDVSPRIVSAPDAGKAKGIAMAPYVEGLVRDYYDVCGWDIEHGKPYRRTLDRLGLSEYIDELWGAK
ncbi:MAG: aldehyde ferredoxin oxidoreductase C-terminal domain-containing protein [Syntrophobacteraceae bacterium]